MARRTSTRDKITPSKVQEVKHNTLIDELQGHTIVADTSALLIRGTDLLRSLPVCDLIIPAIVVKELEGKRSSPAVGFLARDWLRLLELLRVTHGPELAKNVPLPDGYGIPGMKIRIEPNHSNQSILPAQLQDGSNDSTILAVTKAFEDESKVKGKVALISNDVPMRIHCTLELGIAAHEISSVTMDSAKPFSGRITIRVADDDVDEFFEDGNIVTKLALIDDQFEGTISRALVDFVHDGNILDTMIYTSGEGLSSVPRSSSNRASGISPKTVEQMVALNYLLKPVDEFPIVSIAGSAGTGKTLLTIAAGLEGVTKGHYQRVLVLRSLHEMGQGQEMGFLPGNVDDKMAPWSGAVMDSLEVIAKSMKNDDKRADPQDVAELKTSVEISPISYLRGRSITDTFMVLDEAQNFSRSELLNILSRAGEGTKVILVADPAQTDNRFLQSGSRAEIWSVIDSMKSSTLFGHMTLTKTERSAVAELAARILAE